MFSEDDLLPLSGLQHLAFCERQWALIHIEQMWEENRLTAEGRVLHNRVHAQTEEVRNDLLIVRSLPVHSLRLGVSGQTDVVEFLRAPEEDTQDSTHLPDRIGRWRPQPVEYKRGKAKRGACDQVQLCAQALCLEEMFGLRIAEGSLFYGTNRRRTSVRFGEELRKRTEALAARMHYLFDRRFTPAAVLIPGCASCSLKDCCLPEIPGTGRTVASYYQVCFRED